MKCVFYGCLALISVFVVIGAAKLENYHGLRADPKPEPLKYESQEDEATIVRRKRDLFQAAGIFLHMIGSVADSIYSLIPGVNIYGGVNFGGSGPPPFRNLEHPVAPSTRNSVNPKDTGKFGFSNVIIKESRKASAASISTNEQPKSKFAPKETIPKEAGGKFGSEEGIPKVYGGSKYQKLDATKNVIDSWPNAVKSRKKRSSFTQKLLAKAGTIVAKYPWILSSVNYVFTKIQEIKKFFGKKTEKSEDSETTDASDESEGQSRRKRDLASEFGKRAGEELFEVYHRLYHEWRELYHHRHHGKKKREVVDFEPAYIVKKKYKNINKISLENDVQLLLELIEAITNEKLPTMKSEEEQNPGNEKPAYCVCVPFDT